MKNILIAAILLAPAYAGAQQNMKIGNLDINPYAGVTESHDSNIYLAPNGEKAAYITRTNLGVDLVENLGSRYDLKAGYMLETINYTKDRSNNDAVHHNASLAFTGKLPKDMTVTVDDKYKQTTDQATSDLIARALRVENNAGFKLEAPLRGDFGFALAANHNYNNYFSKTYSMLDREEFLAGFDVSYKLQPKTTLFAAYRYGTLNYQSGYTNDATYNNVDLGVTGKLANKLTGTVKAGMQSRKYDKDLNNAKNTASTMQYSVQTVWMPIEKTDVTLYAKRGNVEVNYGDARYYTTTLTDLSVSRMVRKVKVGVGVSAEHQAYSDRQNSLVTTGKKRADDLTTARITADYNVQKWMSLNLGYFYKDRSSNISSVKFNDSVITLGAKLMF